MLLSVRHTASVSLKNLCFLRLDSFCVNVFFQEISQCFLFFCSLYVLIEKSHENSILCVGLGLSDGRCVQNGIMICRQEFELWRITVKMGVLYEQI